MSPPDLLAPGAVFAQDYTVVRPLSEGGMGALYVVQQISTGAPRALKLMHKELGRDPRLRQRFEQEARVGARIESDHVVQVIAAGVDEPSGTPFLVMELLHGQDLSQAIRERGALPVPEVREIFSQLTHAVAAAHRVGIVHRDLKPENVFLSVAQRDGAPRVVKVLDFGIAKVVAEVGAATTQALGTPMWMAPEQTERGRAITPATDVWALGLIAFRMLTGRHFWISANDEDVSPTMVLREVVIDAIVGASERARQYGVAHLLPAGFDAWFALCVDRRQEARFEHAGAVRAAFAALHDQAPPRAVAQRTIAEAPAGVAFEATALAAPGPPAGSLPYTPAPPAGSVPRRSALPAEPVPYTPAPPAGAVPYTPAPPVGAVTPPPYTPASGPMFPYGAGPSAPVAHPTPPPPTVKSARTGGGAGALIGGLAIGGIVVLGGAGLGIRALLRSASKRECSSGKADGKLAACRTACDAEPAKYCVTHGDLARTLLDAASLDDAKKSYERGCDAGDFLACRKLGSLEEVQNDEPLALASYTKSCDGKSASGCAWLGMRLERGRGIARDLARAASLYESACRSDPASCALQAFRAENEPLPRPDAATLAGLYQQAAPALRKECASGGLVECVELGYLLQTGKGVDPDAATAATLFHKACEGGLRAGCNGEAVLEVLSGGKAVEALRSACAAGLVASCNNAAMLEAGVPVTLRQEQGVSLLRASCSEALPLGCTQSGAAALPAPGTPRDLAGAAVQLQKACSDGLGIACANLGALQENGFAGARTGSAAAYEKACASGAGEGCGPMRQAPFQKGEAWSGTYACGQGQTDVTLRILGATPDQRVSAIFDFDYDHGRTTGRFLLSGTYDAARSSLTLTPGVWLEQPPGWITVGMSGQVSLQKTVFAGKMNNPSCGAFRVARLVSDMVATACASGSRFVEGHGCVPVPRAGPTLAGAWTGRGVETNGATWGMTATVSSFESGLCAQTTYTTGCTVDWYCLKPTDGSSLRAREIVTTGIGRCDTTGSVEMTVSDDGKSASYRWWSPSRTGTATSRLARADGRAPP